MLLTDVFSAEAVASVRTSDVSNSMAYAGLAFSQIKNWN